MSDTRPTLQSIDVTQVVDVSSGEATLELSATALDDDQIDDVVFYFDRDVSYNFGSASNGSIRTGWANGNTSSSSYTITDSSMNGEVNITSVRVEDSTGNRVIYPAEDLANMGLDHSFEVVGGRSAPRASLVASQERRDFDLALFTDSSLDAPKLDIDITFSSRGASFEEFFIYGSGALSSSFSTINETSIASFTASLAGAYDPDDPLVGFAFDVETAGSVSVASINVRIDGQSYVVEPADFDFIEVPNAPPKGSVAIIGETENGAVLTADISGLSDADGLGAFAYQWLRDGAAIPGANGKTHTFTKEDESARISVQVSYTDAYGTNEAVNSAPVTDIIGGRTVFGQILGQSGTPVPDANVQFIFDGQELFAQQTGAAGDFSLLAAPETAGRLVIEHFTTAKDLAEIGVSDALDALRLAVGLDLAWGQPDGADFVAADFDGNGRVTVSDALDILRTAVGLETGDSEPRWVFGDLEDFAGANANDIPLLDDQIDIPARVVDTELQIKSILVGNMTDYV